MPLRSTASFHSGVTVRVADIAYGTVTESGPGSLTGRASVTFTLALTNDSTRAVGIGTVQVQATYSAARTPASASNVSDTRPFSGSLGPGRSATGTYAFAIPVPEQRNVGLTVAYRTGQPTVLLTGPAR